MARTPGVSGDVVAANLIVNGVSVGLQSVANTDATTGAFTMPVTDIIGAAEVYLLLTGAQGGGVNIQLPLAATVAATLPLNSVPPGGVASWYMRIINAGTGQILTITTNTGWTLNGTMTLANNTWRDFIVGVTASGAAILTNVGTGTYS